MDKSNRTQDLSRAREGTEKKGDKCVKELTLQNLFQAKIVSLICIYWLISATGELKNNNSIGLYHDNHD